MFGSSIRCVGVLVFEVNDILEGQKGDQGGGPQNGKNSIWGKTGHLQNYRLFSMEDRIGLLDSQRLFLFDRKGGAT